MTTTIIVGAGSSGGVIAARLAARSSDRVVLVEAGPDYPVVSAMPDALRDAENPSLDAHDWGHPCYWVEPPGARPAGLYPRGRVVGGTSAVNAALAVRGTVEDFDDWASMGNSQWSWEHVLPYFVRLESDADFGAEAYHGSSGPVPITRADFDAWPTASQAMARALVSMGIPVVDDHNAPYSTGIGPTPRNKIGGLRASSALAYLAAVRDLPHLEVRPRTLVTRVILEDGRAVGVEVLDDQGRPSRIDGDRVVLSAGAIKTPQILMLSGIGDPSELEALGIEVRCPSPGVGKALQDHPFIPLIFTAANEAEDRYGFRSLLRHGSGHPEGSPNDLAMAAGFIRTSSMNFETPADVSAAVMAPIMLAKPLTTGWLRLATTDPTAHPEIHLNYLDHPVDMRRMLDAVRFVLGLLGSDVVRPEIGPPLLCPSPEEVADDALLSEWLRAHATTAFHPTSTCRMGPADDPGAVVDQDLRTRGIQGLWIADASVLPTVPTAYTNLTCYMVGERAADLLSDDRNEGSA